MWTIIKKVVHDCLTGIDGVSYDPARIYGAMAVNVFFALALVDVLGNGQPFNAQSYGVGFGVLLAGFGLGVQLKKSTEPGQNEPEGAGDPETK